MNVYFKPSVKILCGRSTLNIKNIRQGLDLLVSENRKTKKMDIINDGFELYRFSYFYTQRQFSRISVVHLGISSNLPILH